MLWFAGTHPELPDDIPDWPDPIRWTPPRWNDTDHDIITIPGGYRRRPVTLAPGISEEIVEARSAVLRGEADGGHGNLNRLKVAVLLAALAERLDVTDDDWRMAGIITATSDDVRDWVTQQMRTADRARARASGWFTHERSHTANTLGDTVERLARWLWRRVKNEPGQTPASYQRVAAGRDRSHFGQALEVCTSRGWLIETDDRLSLGESAPGEEVA